jgi:hypothetical protein
MDTDRASTAAPPAFTGWVRTPGRRQRWRAVCGGSEHQCYAALLTRYRGQDKGQDKIVLPFGRDTNAAGRPR